MKYLRTYEMNNEESPLLNRTHAKISKFISEALNMPFSGYLSHNKFEAEFKTQNTYHMALITEKRIDGAVYFYIKRSISNFELNDDINMIENFFKTIFEYKFIDEPFTTEYFEFKVEKKDLASLSKVTVDNWNHFKTASRFDL